MFCMYLCLCTMCVPGTQEDQKRVSDLVPLELQSHYEPLCNFRKQTQVLWKSNLGSLPLCSLSS